MKDRNDQPMGVFPTTHWSLIVRAGEASEEDRRRALGVLLQRYLPALRAYLVLTRRIDSERAEDLLQGFIADKVIEQNLVAAARQERGRFRTFLLAALGRYVVDQYRKESAAHRSSGQPTADADAMLDGGDYRP